MHRKYPLSMEVLGIDLMVPENVYYADEGYVGDTVYTVRRLLKYHHERIIRKHFSYMANEDGGFAHFISHFGERFVHIFYTEQGTDDLNVMNRATWEMIGVMLLGEFHRVMERYNGRCDWNGSPIDMARFVGMSTLPGAAFKQQRSSVSNG